MRCGKTMTRRRNYKLGDIVGRFGGELIGDCAIRISQVATVAAARPSDIAFISQSRYLGQLRDTRAGAVILGTDARDATTIARIICSNPYAYFAKVSALLNPSAATVAGVHKTAAVAKSARVDKTAGIGAGAVIGDEVRIGKRVQIGAGCFVGDGSIVGDDTSLHANVSVYHQCRIGARCIVHAGNGRCRRVKQC